MRTHLGESRERMFTMKKTSVLILTILSICLCLIFKSDKNYVSMAMANKQIDSKSHFRCETTKTNNSTTMDFDIHKNSLALLGREFWKKGEQIKIRINSQKDNINSLKIGIIPAEDTSKGYSYDSYGVPITKTIDNLKNLTTEVEFIVPQDGEYGLFIQNMSPSAYNYSYDKEVAIFDDNYTNHSQVNIPFTKNQKLSTDFDESVDYISLSLELNKVFVNPLVK